RDRRQSRDGRRPDRAVRARVPHRQPPGDAAERLDAARPDREEHLVVRLGGLAAAAADLGRRRLGKPLVATPARRDHGDRRGGGAVMTAVREETVQVWNGRLRLRVKVAGDGPPLLYFHPLPGLAWGPLLDQLASRYT